MNAGINALGGAWGLCLGFLPSSLFSIRLDEGLIGILLEIAFGFTSAIWQQ